MSHPSIRLRPVVELLSPNAYFVPSYQRGFRWSEREVKALLNDIWEFRLRGADPFYCLQPLVVKKRELPSADGGKRDVWEVVDGQQRLTTIYLILTHLRPLLERYRRPLFTLEYETRNITFLEHLDPATKGDNIDNFHLCEALETIRRWFDVDHPGGYDIEFLRCLLNTNDLGPNVRVIWYELPEHENAIKAFTRLNVGKIPLTNAELVRALFLKAAGTGAEPGRPTAAQLRVAQEWDTIEKTLQRPAVWYFLADDHDVPPSRIVHIFRLLERKHDQTAATAPAERDRYHTFHFFQRRLAEPDTTPEKLWREVKQLFLRLEEWFEDRDLYHLVGYALATGDDLLTLLKAGDGLTKIEFQRFLKDRIHRGLCDDEPLPAHASEAALCDSLREVVKELVYGRDSETIRHLLLLFNIATLAQDRPSNLRFPFERYKVDNWDLEHVRSVESGKPKRPDDQKAWLSQVRKFLLESDPDTELNRRATGLLDAAKFDQSAFDRLYFDLLAEFGEKEQTEAENRLGNLTLLDAGTNRSYGNAIFPVKRRRILQLDRAGIYVLPGTRNVFLKCYSRSVEKMLQWTDHDRSAYETEIVKTLARFFAAREVAQ